MITIKFTPKRPNYIHTQFNVVMCLRNNLGQEFITTKLIAYPSLLLHPLNAGQSFAMEQTSPAAVQ